LAQEGQRCNRGQPPLRCTRSVYKDFVDRLCGKGDVAASATGWNFHGHGAVQSKRVAIKTGP